MVEGLVGAAALFGPETRDLLSRDFAEGAIDFEFVLHAEAAALV